MKTASGTCVIYSRVSTEHQSNKSQIDDLKNYAKYMKYSVLGVFDEIISGKTKASDRLAFKELLNFIETHPVDNLIVWELSRLGRNLKDVLTTIELLTEKRINVYAKKENISTLNDDKTINNTANMILGIMGSVAQYERTTIIDRSKRGLHHHLKSGGAFSLSPYGYTNLNGKIVVDANEAEIVKEIYKLFIGGMASPSISKHLNLTNIPTKKDVKWNDVQVRDILHNTMYFGQRKYNFGFVEVPAIVSKSDYLTAQQIFKKNSNLNKDKAIFQNYLSGLVVCGECGSGYFIHARKSRKDFAYKCMSNRKATLGQLTESCGNNSIGINLLNSMVYYALFALLVEFSKRIHKEKHISKFNKSRNHELSNIRREIDILKAEIEKSSNKTKRLTELVVSNVIDEAEYLSQKNKIEDGIIINSNRLNQLLINESTLNQSSTSDAMLNVEQFVDQINTYGVKSLTERYDMGIELYKRLIKTFILSVEIKKSSISDHANLEKLIPKIHHERITRIVITTLFNKYDFYTVTGFNGHSYQLLNNKLHKMTLVQEINQ
ncbi:MAG: recombinase family protein [Bacteroidales bacterium]|nr:recombinase family protein [Bacteroidales bacterium]